MQFERADGGTIKSLDGDRHDRLYPDLPQTGVDVDVLHHTVGRQQYLPPRVCLYTALAHRQVPQQRRDLAINGPTAVTLSATLLYTAFQGDILTSAVCEEISVSNTSIIVHIQGSEIITYKEGEEMGSDDDNDDDENEESRRGREKEVSICLCEREQERE